MPITLFHFGPGAALYAMAPRHVSFLSFIAANILIDVEPLYYMLMHQYPLHRFFHTWIGATLISSATFGLFILARKLASFATTPSWFMWQDLQTTPVAISAVAGSYLHIVLDSIMHSDISPFAPFSEANNLRGIVSLDTLQWSCAGAGLAALVLSGVRRLVRKQKDA